MDILKLMIVFGVLVVMLWLKRPLYQGILGAAAAVCILFGIAPAEAFNTALLSVTGWGTLSVLLVFYLITFLQRMLEKRDFLNLAQASLNGIFNNRRINASLAPVFIGLLPSAGAVIICGDIVEKAWGRTCLQRKRHLLHPISGIFRRAFCLHILPLSLP